MDPPVWKVKFFGSNVGFHGFSWFEVGFSLFFMVPVRFSWFQVGFHGFSWFQVGLSWFQFGFHGFSRFQVGFFMILGRFSWIFIVPGWFFISHVENTLKLYSGPTIQSRPCRP